MFLLTKTVTHFQELSTTFGECGQNVNKYDKTVLEKRDGWSLRNLFSRC